MGVVCCTCRPARPRRLQGYAWLYTFPSHSKQRSRLYFHGVGFLHPAGKAENSAPFPFCMAFAPLSVIFWQDAQGTDGLHIRGRTLRAVMRRRRACCLARSAESQKQEASLHCRGTFPLNQGLVQICLYIKERTLLSLAQRKAGYAHGAGSQASFSETITLATWASLIHSKELRSPARWPVRHDPTVRYCARKRV
jgi:hypothetical protein